MREILSKNTRCKVGVARRDITAPVGIYARYWGAAKHDVADGVHRPATATAMVMSAMEGEARLALVAVDFGSFHPMADERTIRRTVQEATGFDEASLIISLSHCHAGANASSNRTDLPGGDKILDYLKFVGEQITAAVAEAAETTEPAWITWGQGKCSLAGNRDLWDAEAQGWGCGFNPDAPADDTVLVGRATRDDGAVKAILFNYACHPTTLAWDNHLLSPDYIGAAREVIEQTYSAPALFFQGASGELGPREGYVGDTEVADRNGRQLGYAVASAVEALPPAASKFVYTGIVSSGADIATWAWQPTTEDELCSAHDLRAEVVTVNLQNKYIPSSSELRAQLEATTDRPLGERLRRRLMIREDLGEGDVYQMSVWVWRLGDAVLVAIPNEPYSILQRTLRQSFADHPVFVLGVTNGTMGYLCPAELYGTGRYQEQQSPFMPGCLEQTIAGASAGIASVLSPAT